MQLNRITGFIALLLGISALGCEREYPAEVNTSSGSTTGPVNAPPASYDTLFPFSYLPAYPGSWWKYVSGKGVQTMVEADSSYVLDFYEDQSAAYISDTFYVPVYNNYPLWGYESHEGPISFSGSYPLRRILSDSLPVWASWNVYHWGGTAVDRKIIAKDTAIAIGQQSFFPTIVIEEYYSSGPPTYIWLFKRYYTKNIGMIREDSLNYNTMTVTTRELDAYFINN